MSNALAVAAVSVVLKDRLQVGLLTRTPPAIGAVSVTALPPDRIPIGAAEPTQLNLFLHQVSSNNGWNTVKLPSRDSDGMRTTNPPLALNLHYLLTAYGARDFHPEVLLGCGMQVLHETPVLTRQSIRDSLGGASLPADLVEVRDAGLADQIEMVKITPQSLNTEELSKLWAALQAHYRPTAAYMVTVVLIEGERPGVNALPVLERRAFVDPALQPPTLTGVVPADRLPARYLGDVLELEGHHLDGANVQVGFTPPRERDAIDVPPTTATGGRVTVTIPNTPAAWVAGYHTVAVSLQRPNEPFRRTTNALPLAIAPHIMSAMPMNVARVGADATINLHCAPEVRPTQKVSLLLDALESAAEPHPAQTNALRFVFRGVPPNTYRVRLRVDGVDSLLIDRAATPPTYIAAQRVTIT